MVLRVEGIGQGQVFMGPSVSVKGDLNHITYETKSEDVKAFNEKHYVAQKENVWGLVYGGTERDTG